MWTTEPHLRFLRKFNGHVHHRFLIRSGFGAPRDRFVMSGSEGEFSSYSTVSSPSKHPYFSFQHSIAVHSTVF